MTDMKMQSAMSWLRPPEGDGLPRYVEAVVEATALRSEAALADLIGVPASAIANWKRRRRIPAEYCSWFETELVREILARNGRVPDLRGKMPISGALRFLTRGDGNPFGLPSAYVDLAHGDLFAGLVALARLAWRVSGIALMDDDAALDAMADRLSDLREQIAQAPAMRVYQ